METMTNTFCQIKNVEGNLSTKKEFKKLLHFQSSKTSKDKITESLKMFNENTFKKEYRLNLQLKNK